MGTGSFPEVKIGRVVMLTPHPLLVPWSRKGRAIPLLPLWAARPVQSLSFCTRVHFTFYFTLLPIYTNNYFGIVTSAKRNFTNVKSDILLYMLPLPERLSDSIALSCLSTYTRPRPPYGSLNFHYLLCKRTHLYPVTLLPIGLSYF
jgi:hypothetical protein